MEPTEQGESKSTTHHIDARVLAMCGGVLVVLIIVIACVMYYSYQGGARTGVEKDPSTLTTSGTQDVSDSTRIEYGQTLPPDFPPSFLPNENTSLSESYAVALEGSGEKQRTIRFTEPAQLGDMYVFYRRMLMQERWVITNQYQSRDIASLYGVKEDAEINITFRARTATTTEIMMSYLK